MDYRQLGRTGVKVSTLCLGAWQFGQRTTREESLNLVKAGLESGINFFDTAYVYGPNGLSEEILGEGLKLYARRDQIFLATKFSMGNSRKLIIEQCETSLRRLQVETIDLYQFHSTDANIPIDESLRALDDLIQMGKVRYIGTSNFTAWQEMELLWAAQASGLPRHVTSQPAYNLLDRAPELELIPMAQTYDVALIPWSPLAQGFLTGKYQRSLLAERSGLTGSASRQADRLQSGMAGTQTGGIEQHFSEAAFTVSELLAKLAGEKGCSTSQLALAWLLYQPSVASVIIGPRDVHQLQDNLGSIAVTLAEEDFRKIDTVIKPGQVLVPYFRYDRRKRLRWY
jgi:aryl-alcohol dehydrogenase-like predicted oxidoreductase